MNMTGLAWFWIIFGANDILLVSYSVVQVSFFSKLIIEQAINLQLT